MIPRKRLFRSPIRPARLPPRRTGFLRQKTAQQRRKHLNLVLAFYGLGIAAVAAMTLLSWSERLPTPPALPGMAGEQLPNPQPARWRKSLLPCSRLSSLHLTKVHMDQTTTDAGIAGSASSYANGGDDQAAEKGATDRASAIPHAARTATITAFATSPAWWDDRASRKPNEFGGTRRRFEARQRRSDFGDVIGNLSRKSMAPDVSMPHVRLGKSSAHSTNRPVT